MRDEEFNTADEWKFIAKMLNRWDIISAIRILKKIFIFHENALKKQNGSDLVLELIKLFNNIQK